MFKFFKEKIGNWAKKVSKEKEKESDREVSVPMKFNEGMQQFQPDLEKLGKVEEELKEEKPGTESFFKKVTSKIQKVKISEKEFEVYSEELNMLLLENNVAFEVSEKIIQELKERIVGKELLKKEIESEVRDALKEIIEEILIEPFNLVQKVKDKVADQSKEPYVILFAGINGTGKTTTIAKIAEFLKRNKISSVMAAADTFRAASIEQIQKHGDRIGVKVISHDYGTDPAAVGFDAIKYAKKNFINCVLIDTAGRMHTAKNLLREIEKISRVCKPDLKLFIGESITGNDSIEQAKSFNWAIGIDGIILTKADVDERGGTALSVGYVTKKPILYLGTGQEYDKIEVFNKKKFIKELGL
jgi:fused signal recognition particle receptor